MGIRRGLSLALLPVLPGGHNAPMPASLVSTLLRPVEAREWKARFQGALSTKSDPAGLHSDLVEGLRKRAWTQLKDSRGKSSPAPVV